MTDEPQDFFSHLQELRQRLIIAILAWLAGFVGCYMFAQQLFMFVAQPLRAALPQGSSLVFIQATEPFFTYLKLSAVAGLLVAMPVVLWQLWLFIAPALHAGESRLALMLVALSGFFLVGGAYLGFTWVFPRIFTFLLNIGVATTGIQPMLSMSGYLSLAMSLLLAFGLVFELPLVIFFLARLGVVDYAWLAGNRRYAFLLAFVVGAILTPPDIFSQIAFALPFIALYEIGVWVARFWGAEKVTGGKEE